MDLMAAGSEHDGTHRSAPSILSENADTNGSRIPFVDTISIGREEGDVRIPDDHYLSRLHARIERVGDHFFLRDCGSTNGTFVQIRPSIELRPGDEILVGGQLFRVML